jgi:uncharacterized membrane protein
VPRLRRPLGPRVARWRLLLGPTFVVFGFILVAVSSSTAARVAGGVVLALAVAYIAVAAFDHLRR